MYKSVYFLSLTITQDPDQQQWWDIDRQLAIDKLSQFVAKDFFFALLTPNTANRASQHCQALESKLSAASRSNARENSSDEVNISLQTLTCNYTSVYRSTHAGG